MVRDHVRDQRKERKRVMARQLVNLLVDMEIIGISKDVLGKYNRRVFNSSYRAMRRCLGKEKYKRGLRTGNLVPSPTVLLKKHQFLRRFWNNIEQKKYERLREVYIDESYINHHYNLNDDSLWDPNDYQDLKIGKAPAKGRRYCFAAAIQGPNWRGDTDRNRDDKDGLVDGSLWLFCPQKDGDHKGDYHKVFNGENFTNWFSNTLLTHLSSPSLIMLDNAKYHTIFGINVPNVGKLRKYEVI